jgi:hypothetical protein
MDRPAPCARDAPYFANTMIAAKGTIIIAEMSSESAINFGIHRDQKAVPN